MLFRNTLQISGVEPNCTLEDIDALITAESGGDPEYDKLWFDETDDSWVNVQTSENIPAYPLQMFSTLMGDIPMLIINAKADLRQLYIRNNL